MSTLKTHNLQSPDAGSVNILMASNAGMIVTGISTFNNKVLLGTDTEGLATYGENLTIGSAGHAGITLRTGTGHKGTVYFSDGTSGTAEYKGSIQYDHSDDSLRLAAGGSVRLFIRSGGEVAIGGVGYAGQPFSVQTSSTNLGYMQSTGTTRAVMNFVDANSTQNVGFGCIGNNHVFMKDGNEKVRIDSNGFLGIDNASPVSSFASARNLVIGTASGNHGMTIMSGTSNSGHIEFSDGTSSDAEKTAGGIRYYHDSDYMRFNTGGGSERLRIDSSGKVSISSDGTIDGLLTIKGDSDQVGTPSIRLLDGSDTREVSISNTSGDFVASVHGNDNAIHGHIKLFESGIIDLNNGGASGSNVNRLRIATDGNVHINTTDNGNASAKLNVEDSSSVGADVLKIMNKPSGANGKAKLVFHTETSAGQGCQPYIQSLSGADAGPNASNNHNAGGFEFHTRSGGSGTDNNALRLRDDGTFEKYGTHGNILLTSTGSSMEFTRGGRNQINATSSNGYIDFHTSAQYSFPAMRIFAAAAAPTGAKVGINTDNIWADSQMMVQAQDGMPGLFSTYGIRLDGNSYDSNKRISNASGVYVIHTTVPANDTFTTVAIGRYHAATVTIRVGDAASKRVMVINYDLTQPAYGVATYNIITNNGNWNTGSADFQLTGSGSYDYALQVKHNSYYNTSNTSACHMNFNVC